MRLRDVASVVVRNNRIEMTGGRTGAGLLPTPAAQIHLIKSAGSTVGANTAVDTGKAL